jgi:hypothetical protein
MVAFNCIGGLTLHKPSVTIIVPPRATSVAGETTATRRDPHQAMIDVEWQRRVAMSFR